MWEVRVTVTVPEASDIEHLAEVAGSLGDKLEEYAGGIAPTVVGRFRAPVPVLEVGLDSTSTEPTVAVSSALELIKHVSEQADIPLGAVHAISLSISGDLEIAPELASA